MQLIHGKLIYFLILSISVVRLVSTMRWGDFSLGLVVKTEYLE